MMVTIMATISFTKKIEITEDQYEKMLNAKPTKKLKKTLEDYKKIHIKK